MRRVVVALLAGAFSFGVAEVAFAKDKPARMAAPAPVSSWTGCYIGGNVGGGWAQTGQAQVSKVGGPAVVPNNDFGTSTGAGFNAGGQIGCDYQFASNWLIGIQAMFDFGNFASSHIEPTAFPGFPVGSFLSENRTKDIFTATVRAGYLFNPRLLGYVKGGGAWTRVDHDFIGFVPTTFLSESATGVNRQGWTVGVGAEWMLAHGWSVFGEFNYLDFGRKDVSFIPGPGTVGPGDIVSTHLTIQQLLVGVNYKFNRRM